MPNALSVYREVGLLQTTWPALNDQPRRVAEFQGPLAYSVRRVGLLFLADCRKLKAESRTLMANRRQSLLEDFRAGRTTYWT